MDNLIQGQPMIIDRTVATRVVDARDDNRRSRVTDELAFAD
jgi:hypothetical protein